MLGDAEGVGEEGEVEVLRATGTAKDRADGVVVEFVALLGHRIKQDRGVLIVGAWKDAAMMDTVKKMLETLRLPKLASAPGD